MDGSDHDKVVAIVIVGASFRRLCAARDHLRAECHSSLSIEDLARTARIWRGVSVFSSSGCTIAIGILDHRRRALRQRNSTAIVLEPCL